MDRLRALAAITAGLGIMAALSPAAAMASSPSPADANSAVRAIEAAVFSQGLPSTTASAASDVILSAQASAGVQLPAEQITLGLPASGAATLVGATNVFAGNGSDNSVLVQPIDGGARAVLEITGAGAPTDFRFPIQGASRLEQLPDGSVAVHDTNDDSSVVIEAPWATDATGKNIPTSYSVDGTTLVQHIAHKGAAYPVVADPTVKQTIKRIISACVKGALGGTSLYAIIHQLFSVKAAVKFIIRRLGFFGAVSCAGNVVFEFI